MVNRLVSSAAVLFMLLAMVACANNVPQPTLAVPDRSAETPVPEGNEGEVSAAEGAEAAETGPSEIVVTMHDIYFGDNSNNQDNPPAWTVPAGADVTLLLNNQGNLEHNWAVVAQGEEITIPYTEEQSDKLLYSSILVAGGEEAVDTFTAPAEVGEYLVICTVAGHYPAMQGRLVVE